MNHRLAGVLSLACLALATAGRAQQDDDAVASERDPAHTQWPWYVELPQPAESKAWYAFAAPPQVLGKAQPDLRDLRLADANGVRVPYVLRVLHAKAELTPVKIVRQFDAGASEKNRFYQVSLELSDIGGPGHNEIEIDMPGTNFRRRVQVFGDKSAAFEDPRPFLAKEKYVVRYETDAGVVSIKRFGYEFKQFRFLQVRVDADPATDKEIPEIKGVQVRRKIVTSGSSVTRPAALQPRQDVRTDDGPGSAWYVDFGEPQPCERLRFTAAGEVVERPHRVQIANPGEPRQDQFGSEWRWEKDGDVHVLEIALRQEVFAQRLRFVVTDFANAPLELRGVESAAAVRQIIFAMPPERFAWPLRVYFGNAAATPARYDLERTLPVVLQPPPVAVTVGDRQANPKYEPPTQPLHEREPWLIYVVLSIASVVLLALLVLLARQALARTDAAEALSEPAAAAEDSRKGTPLK